jgi:RNA polymerase sigma-70 factor (ECF subfamily)
VHANGSPGFAQYKPDPENGGFMPWSIQVIEISEGRIAGFHCFLDTQRWFPLFGVPLHLDD